tara:strand:+ start:263 stop:364 length:102 start_codon:yes stop_codon:yes gene_type:complete
MWGANAPKQRSLYQYKIVVFLKQRVVANVLLVI